jgi:steroid delta-isomerase-like uncharacterized protein
VKYVGIEENKIVGRRWIEEVWQKGSSLDELIDENFSFDYPSMEHDRQTYMNFVKLYLESFPDLKFTVEDIVAERDKVAIHWKAQGTHKGEFWGVPPTGKKVIGRGISIIQIKNGKIVKEWGYQNNLEFMQQISPTQQQ